MYYWVANSDDGAYCINNINQCFKTQKEAYDDMRDAALEKVKWNTQYDEDYADGTEVIDYDIHFKFSQNKIIHESYSGTYTYEIKEKR